MRNQTQCLLHVLKIEEDYMRDVVRCDKKAEFRINDRDYQVGDLIHFVKPMELSSAHTSICSVLLTY